ncbi:MAG: FHA domain-containing protein [Clostridia bacterium]|nr:FHA domain-containing protein [Clostridia bacterium]
MKSSKIVFKKGVTLFCVKGKANQELNEREVHEINQNGVPGFLGFQVERTGRKFKLIYDLTGLVSLREFLQFNIISERILKKLLQSMFDSLDIASKLYFNRNLIQFTMDTVLVNPADWQICFIYVPVQPFDAVGSVKDVLNGIISMASFNPREDTAYIQRFIEILNDGVNFSEFAIKEFAQSLYGSSYNPSATYVEESHDCDCEEDKSPESPAGVYNPLAALKNTATCDETVSIYSDFWLISQRDGSKTRVEGIDFRIGKTSGYSDLFINNRAVSRKHAEIINDGGTYYLVDLNSTNGTALNGKKIPPEVRVEISAGDRLVFADEEYIFDRQ